MADPLLQIKGLVIEATSYPPGEPPKEVTLVHGVDLTLQRGRVLGLIGESGAGKSTIGLSAMAYGRGGVRLTGGTIHLNGREIRLADAKALRSLRGREVTYVSQSAAASFNPATQIMEQVIETCLSHGLCNKAEAEARAKVAERRARIATELMHETRVVALALGARSVDLPVVDFRDEG